MSNLSPFLPWLVDFYAGATVLLGLAALAIRAVQQPAKRRLIGCATCVGLCCLLLTSVVPLWPRVSVSGKVESRKQKAEIGDQRTEDRRQKTENRGQTTEAGEKRSQVPGLELANQEHASEIEQNTAVIETPNIYPHTASGWSWAYLFTYRILPASFLLIASLIGGWLLLGAWLTHRLIKHGILPSEEVRAVLTGVTSGQPARLLVSTGVTQPVAAGVFRPTIVIPSALAAKASGPELRAALAHEWHHIRRGDLLFLAVSRLLMIVLFAHPLFWWLKRRIYLDQEYLADHAAARSSTPIIYAEFLLRWSQARCYQPLFAWAAAASTRGSRLKRRMAMLLRTPQALEVRVNPRWRCLISSAAAVCVLLVSFATLWPQRELLAQDRSPTPALDAPQENFSLKPDSELRRDEVGAADLIARASPWPLQPEEQAMIPEGETREWNKWKRSSAATTQAAAATPTPAPPAAGNDLPSSANKTDNPLQALIDAAQPGGTVLVLKGVYTLPITIAKALTLRGENKEACRLEVTSDQPAVSVLGQGPTKIENLTIQWQRQTSERREQPPCAVYFKDAKGVVENCNVRALGNSARCPAGILANGFCELNLTQTQSEGFDFAIQYHGGAQGSVRDCIVRNPGHCGITVGNDADVTIERNIVTGSEFHGVRCTGGRLNVRDNLIAKNKNRGVYLGNRRASGEVANNLILGNETGISAFADSDVKIHNNLITGSGFAGLDMRATCALDITQNIFHENKAGIILFAEKGKQSATLGQNTFWKNATNLTDLQFSGQLLEVEPGFKNSAGGDFSVSSTALHFAQQGLVDPAILHKLWQRWEALPPTSR